MTARYVIGPIVRHSTPAVALMCLYSFDCLLSLHTGFARAANASAFYVVLHPDSGNNDVTDMIAERHGLRRIGDESWHIETLGQTAVILSRRNSGVGQLPGVKSDDQLLRSLMDDPSIDLAGRITEYQLSGKPSRNVDPYFGLQHSLATTRIDESHRIATGKGVRIGIIDTGLDRHHEDLVNQLKQSLNFVDADPTAQPIEFHATAVAGIIGAEADNNKGISGVAPGANLYALRACTESNPGTGGGTCTTVALARAIDWAIVNRLQVINMSLEGQSDPLVTRLIQRAVEAGAIVVAATTLRNGSLAYPASLDEVIAVSDQESNSLVGLAAHSERIFIAPGEEILTTMPNNTYDFVTGASFAAAHVTGIVALLLERAPAIDAFEARRLLRNSLRVINWGIIVDSCAALALIDDDLNCYDRR